MSLLLQQRHAQGFELSHRFESRLKRLLDGLQSTTCLTQGQIGLEKECLRVTDKGRISQAAHPSSLGSALTHPYITTDYSEALMEFITPPESSASLAMEFLQDLQHYVYRNLDDEVLWPSSMPCVVEGESSIPIAHYGSSNAGMMKHVYRRGLGFRYGRVMQVISGVHFNYSLADEFWTQYREILGVTKATQQFINDEYFCMIRNLLRFGWFVPYLFGASPAVCKSFFAGNKPPAMDVFNESTFYEPYATSLRLGDIGYQNKKEVSSGVHICYDDVYDYTECLGKAISTPLAEYEAIGVKEKGEYRQLNVNTLQIENEYYSSVRPKQLTGVMEMPAIALRERGVRYVELRSIDVNVFDHLGVNQSQLHFLELLMLFCLLNESPPIGSSERSEIDFNLLQVAHQGRRPGLKLKRAKAEVSLREWGMEVLEQMQGLAEVMDLACGCNSYTQSLLEQREKFDDPAKTPSAHFLEEMSCRNTGFFDTVMEHARKLRENCLRHELGAEREKMFNALSIESLTRQKQMEANDEIGFDDYLSQYFSALGKLVQV